MFRWKNPDEVSVHAVAERLGIFKWIQSSSQLIHYVKIKKRYNVNVAGMLLSRRKTTINPLRKLYIT